MLYLCKSIINFCNLQIIYQRNDGKPAVRYNLKGQRVDENYKGVVIINGKKVVIK